MINSIGTYAGVFFTSEITDKGLRYMIPHYVLDPDLVKADQDTDFTGKVAVPAPVDAVDVARYQDVVAVQSASTQLESDIRIAVANVHRETAHAVVDTLASTLADVPTLAGQRFIPVATILDLIVNMPYTVESDGSYTPDAHGVEIGDDVVVRDAENALTGDIENVSYFYTRESSSESPAWHQIPTGLDVARVIAARNSAIIRAGTGLKQEDGKNHIDVPQLLEGGAAQVNASLLVLEVNTTEVVPTNNTLGAYIEEIDATISGRQILSWTKQLSESEANGGFTVVPTPSDYVVDTKELPNAWIRVCSYSFTNKSNAWTLGSTVYLNGTWNFTYGQEPTYSASSDGATALDAVGLASMSELNGLYTISGSALAVPVATLGIGDVLTWRVNGVDTQLYALFQTNFNAPQMSFSAQVPLKLA